LAAGFTDHIELVISLSYVNFISQRNIGNCPNCSPRYPQMNEIMAFYVAGCVLVKITLEGILKLFSFAPTYSIETLVLLFLSIR